MITSAKSIKRRKEKKRINPRMYRPVRIWPSPGNMESATAVSLVDFFIMGLKYTQGEAINQDFTNSLWYSCLELPEVKSYSQNMRYRFPDYFSLIRNSAPLIIDPAQLYFPPQAGD